jgi:hypothetical protein
MCNLQEHIKKKVEGTYVCQVEDRADSEDEKQTSERLRREMMNKSSHERLSDSGCQIQWQSWQ